MKVLSRPLAGVAGLLLAMGVSAAAVPASAATSGAPPGTAATGPAATGTAATGTAAARVIGIGHARAHSITVRAADRRQVRAESGIPAPLGRNGRPAGRALPAAASPAATARPVSPATRARGANSGKPASSRATELGGRPVITRAGGRAVTANTSAQLGFSGITEGSSNCTNCQTPDVSAAVNATEIAETANLNLQVFNKSGSTLCTVSLASLLGATTQLSRPRIQYDNANNRFSLVIDSVPSSAYDVPVQYLATSQTSDACGAWWVYSLTFPISSSYPLGATLDYPYLGQDSTSILSSTNNYNSGSSYVGSAAYAMPKSAAYTGAGFSFTTYSVAFSTAPVTVAGIPTFSTTTTYWLAAVPGTGYDLYSMPTSPAGAITLTKTISAPFSAPSRQVRQPGTSRTLSPLDGRIQSSPVQDGSYVWFANDVNYSGFPTVLYGAINVKTYQASTALAFHSSTSDDFNPSIGVTDAGNNTNYIWVNWAYTDTPYGVPVSATVAGVAPGQGVPVLDGADLTLVTGSSTATISTFGGYSSAEIDPVALNSSCPAGLTALTAQEYFTSSGSWTTELARTTFC